MKPTGVLFQFVAIGIAVAIALLFVRPTFNETGMIQNDTLEYAKAREQVAETNQTLAALVAKLDSVSVLDSQRLATYIPTQLDEIFVLRDLENIVEVAGVAFTAIEYSGEWTDDSEEARMGQQDMLPAGHQFDIQITGSYNRIKDFLSLLEQNQYPLHAYSLGLSTLEGGFLQADITVVTFADSSVEELFQ